MTELYLGFVERISLGKPGARLRPVAQSSNDKTKWHNIDQSFPNSDVVSWWYPPKDLRKGSYWIFQISDSPKYDIDNKQHDQFRVQDEPYPATQVLTLSNAKDEDTIRRALVTDGIPADQCVTRHVYVVSSPTHYLGPLKLTFKGDRAFVDSHDVEHAIALQEKAPTVQFYVEKEIAILPTATPYSIFRKTGEIDFSADDVFLKRVLKDLKETAPESLGTAKLTNKLIDIYVRSFVDKQLTPLTRYRLQRLKSLAQSEARDMEYIEQCLAIMKEWEPVRSELELAKVDAVTRAVEGAREQIDKLTRTKDELESKKKALSTESKALDDNIAVQRKQQDALLKEFDESVKSRLQSVEKDAAGFLANISLIKAAMNAIDGKSSSHPEHLPRSRPVDQYERLTQQTFLIKLKGAVAGVGLDWWSNASLTATLAAGFVPLLYGSQSRDHLAAISRTIAGNKLYSLPLNASQLTQTDLSDAVVTCDDINDDFTISLSALLDQVRRTDEIYLLCLEGLNLCQMDALLLPLMRRYCHLQRRIAEPGETQGQIMTPVGLWPKNLLLIGTIADSPLSLPVSRALWETSALVRTPITFDPALPAYKVEFAGQSVITSMESVEWTAFIRDSVTSPIPAGAMNRTLWTVNNRSGLDFTARTSALIKTLQVCLPDATEEARLLVHLAVSLVPYALSTKTDPEPLSAEYQGTLPQVSNLITSQKELFQKWGLECN